MSIEFQVVPEHQAIIIRVGGYVKSAEVRDMRTRTVELAKETGYPYFIMDIGELKLIEHSGSFAVFELGNEFRDSDFPLRSKTAVIMPNDPEALKQVEFLHTVELNRGRGSLRYVDTVEQAYSWFLGDPVEPEPPVS